MKSHTLRMAAVGVGGGLALISTVGVTVLLLVVTALLRPAIAFDARAYTPADSTLCPGEVLVYTRTVSISRAPAMPRVGRVWYDTEAEQPVVLLPLQTYILLNPTPPPVPQTVTETVPPLAPGNYELRVGVLTGQISAYRVPFTVPDGCVQ